MMCKPFLAITVQPIVQLANLSLMTHLTIHVFRHDPGGVSSVGPRIRAGGFPVRITLVIACCHGSCFTFSTLFHSPTLKSYTNIATVQASRLWYHFNNDFCHGHVL